MARPHECPAPRRDAIEQHLAALRDLRSRWIAEYPGICAADPERARHHAEAIADLCQVIACEEQALAVLALFTDPPPRAIYVTARTTSTRSRARAEAASRH